MQYGFFEGCFIGNRKFPELNKKLRELAEKYGVSETTIAFAWILRHPAKMLQEQLTLQDFLTVLMPQALILPVKNGMKFIKQQEIYSHKKQKPLERVALSFA